jgi:hypothetical protein
LRLVGRALCGGDEAGFFMLTSVPEPNRRVLSLLENNNKLGNTNRLALGENTMLIDKKTEENTPTSKCWTKEQTFV